MSKVVPIGSLPASTSSWLAVLARFAGIGMALGLIVFYKSHAPGYALIGLVIFSVFAACQPHVGLLAVVATVPFFFIPAQINNIRATPVRLPLHEVALLLVAVISLARWQGPRIWQRVVQGTSVRALSLPAIRWNALRYSLPYVLLVIAGTLGVVWAVPEGRGAALREWRWLIIEPLLFYVLLTVAFNRSGTLGLWNQACAVGIFVVSGVVVAAVGLLQFAGIDPVWLLGTKPIEVASIFVEPSVWRVTSVYGSPNNLGLYLGRVWPLALALLMAAPTAARLGVKRLWDRRWWLAVAVACCLAGLIVSFSRGAWLGAGAALLVLALPAIRGNADQRRIRHVVLLGAVFTLIVGLALSIRGGLISANALMRFSFWREGLWLIQQHPLGIGLDQFFYYHNPIYGRSHLSSQELATIDSTAAHPHNLVLDIWLRLGPLGFIAFVWLVLRFFYQARVLAQAAPQSSTAWLIRGACAAMVAALVHGSIDQFYFVPDLAFAFWLLIALVEARYARRAHDTPNLG